MPDFSNLVLRWSIGSQDTTSLSEFELKGLKDYISLAKLSIVSFQKWFPGARFVVLYNGENIEDFREIFQSLSPSLLSEIEFIDQVEQLQSGEVENRYRFYPRGVWWKWLPFRLDINKHEIAIDTDIICISEPKSWYKWFSSDEELIVAPERYENIIINTCGDFWNHALLKDKSPLNCGVVGQRAGSDFRDRFFSVVSNVELGTTHNSMFITEQGAINMWVYSLLKDGVNHLTLDFERNCWIRDFLFYLEKQISVETVHATTWHKKIANNIIDALKRRIFDENYEYSDFISDVLKQTLASDLFSKDVILRQIGVTQTKKPEFLFV